MSTKINAASYLAMRLTKLWLDFDTFLFSYIHHCRMHIWYHIIHNTTLKLLEKYPGNTLRIRLSTCRNTLDFMCDFDYLISIIVAYS